jgi:hypothetical protein
MCYLMPSGRNAQAMGERKTVAEDAAMDQSLRGLREGLALFPKPYV